MTTEEWPSDRPRPKQTADCRRPNKADDRDVWRWTGRTWPDGPDCGKSSRTVAGATGAAGIAGQWLKSSRATVGAVGVAGSG